MAPSLSGRVDPTRAAPVEGRQLLDANQVMSLAALHNKHSAEEQVFVDTDISLNPKVASRAALGCYSGIEPPPELVEMIRRRAMWVVRDANLLRQLKYEAERWIKLRFCDIPPEGVTYWVNRAVSDGFAAQEPELRLLEALPWEFGDKLNRVSRLAGGERAERYGTWDKVKWHTLWWVPRALGGPKRHNKLPSKAPVPK